MLPLYLNLHFLGLGINVIVQHVFSFVWILSFSMIILKLIHAACILAHSVFISEWYSIIYIYHCVIYPFTCCWTLDCFQFLIITNKTVLNILTQVFVWVYALFSIVGMSRSGMLDHMVSVIFTIFFSLMPNYWYFKGIVSFEFSIKNVWECWFLYILTNSWDHKSCLILATLMEAYYYFIMVLSCIL